MNILLSLIFAQQLTIATIPGFSTIPTEKISEVIQEANPYFSEMGFRFRYKIISIASASSDCFSTDYNARENQLKCLHQEVKPTRKKLFFFFTEPWNNGTNLVYGGRAEDFCANVAMGSYNEYSTQYTGMMVAHEVAHLMCATHVTSSPNLMSPIIGFPKKGIMARVSEVTKRQVKRWYARNR